MRVHHLTLLQQVQVPPLAIDVAQRRAVLQLTRFPGRLDARAHLLVRHFLGHQRLLELPLRCEEVTRSSRTIFAISFLKMPSAIHGPTVTLTWETKRAPPLQAVGAVPIVSQNRA